MAGVTVEINGKETVSKAAQDATGSIEKLSGGTKSLVSSFTDVKAVGDTVIGAIKAISATVGEMVTEYASIERSTKLFNSSMEIASQMTEGAAERMSDFAEAIAKVTGADDDAVRSLETFLVQAGRTEEEIKAIMTAATNLAASGFGTLESNISLVNNTFSGMTRGLDRLIPGLKDVSKESLEAGAAADIINEQFGGLLETVASLSDVSINNFKNLVDDYKGAIGGGIEILLKPIRDAFTNLGQDNLEQFEIDVQNVALTIQGIFNNLPAFAKLSFQTMGVLFAKTFEWGTIGTIFESVVKNILMVFATGFKQIPIILSEIMKNQKLSPAENAKLMGMNLVNNAVGVFGGGQVFDTKELEKKLKGSNTIETTVGLIFDAIVGQLKVEGKALKDIGGTLDGLYGDILKKYTIGVSALKSAMPSEASLKLMPRILEATKLVPTGYDLSTSFGNTRGRYNQETGPISYEIDWQGIGKILGQGMFEGYRGNINESNIGSMPKNRYSGVSPEYSPTSTTSFMSGVTGGTDVGNMISGIPLGGAGVIGQLINSISSVNAILNPTQTILQGFMSVVGPLVDTILKPIVGILIIVGEWLGKVLAPILSALGPAIKFVGDAFVWLYNYVLLPFGNIVIALGNIIYNIVEWVASGFGLARKANYIAVGSGMLTSLSSTDLSVAGSTSGSYGASSTSGGSANYATQRDVIVNINIYGGEYIGEGGFRQFAIRIKNELTGAGVLGLA
jgi:hypothetical protein